ncbi:hypothetical protein ACWEJ6_24750 [Nonomuraea sp. NPDC004702]
MGQTPHAETNLLAETLRAGAVLTVSGPVILKTSRISAAELNIGICRGSRLRRSLPHDDKCMVAAALVGRTPAAGGPGRSPAARLATDHALRGRGDQHARTFLEHLRTIDEPLYATFVLMLVLGLRRGEVLGLTWDSINLDGQEL